MQIIVNDKIITLGIRFHRREEGQSKHVDALIQIAKKFVKIRVVLIDRGFRDVEILNNLESAVQRSNELANSGDNVLLSPGCSSFDMFKDYGMKNYIDDALKEFKTTVLNINTENYNPVETTIRRWIKNEI